MDRNLKKCYYFMDLPFSATEEEVRVREKVMIKVLNAREINSGKQLDKKINKIVECSNKIVDNIKKFGIASGRNDTIKKNVSRLYFEIFILLLLSMVCITTFIALL